MSVWEWAAEFDRAARARGDRDRMRLAVLLSEAYSLRHSDPSQMLALLQEARQLARVLEEPWWELFFDHWIVETYVYYLEDYRNVLDLAVQCTLQLRKPGFEKHPLRFAVYCNLIAAYLCVDPRGHADAVRAAIDYLQRETPPKGGDRFLLQARRHWLEFELGNYDRARALALEELVLADAESDHLLARHHGVDTYKALCHICFRVADWQGLRNHSATGAELAGWGEDYPLELAQFLLWQALVARVEGQAERARHLFRKGQARMARLGKPPDGAYHDAVSAYHETGQEYPLAWATRQDELRACMTRGQRASEVQCRLKRCRLLKLMGQPIEEEAEAVRQAAAGLHDPSWYLGELERILAE